MRRRQFLASLLAGSFTAPRIARAQQRSRPAIVGYFGSRTGVPAETDAFLQAIQDLGYVEGRDVLIVYRSGPPPPTADLPRLALELVQRNPDVIVSSGGAPAI